MKIKEKEKQIWNISWELRFKLFEEISIKIELFSTL